ncbi:hypothetical protein WCP94_000052 (plasmid) [Bilophila wadsworthia]
MPLSDKSVRVAACSLSATLWAGLREAPRTSGHEAVPRKRPEEARTGRDPASGG